MNSHYSVLGVSAMLATSLLTFSCASRQPAVVQTPGSPATPAAATPVATSKPATLDDARAVVKRVFKDAATIHETHEPSFLTGDFNGDNSPDIAMIVKPVAGKIAEINQQFPPWILKNPFIHPKPGDPPLRIAANESLLAVTHGYERDGWRDPQATQTYVLKNAVGSDLKAHLRTDFVTASEGKKLPRLVGDLIGTAVRGKSGYLYFSGATYSWYDPKTFKGEASARLVHPGMTPKKQVDLLNLRSSLPAREK